MTAKEIHVTPEGLKALEAELEHLKTVRRKDVAEKIKVARGYGDLSENAEYDAAKDEQGELEGRIAELESQLKNVHLINSDELSTDHVGVGTTVRVEDLDEEDEEFKYMEFAITGATEADPDNNKISDESPVGAGLIGKKVGNVAEITLPTGAVARFKVLSIARS
ncbi:MAG: transcription elongation factor GreA [Oscillospiraceae bacterium]|nr:transcription elongation factor GreA [Oscillospiraceae bacterium]